MSGYGLSKSLENGKKFYLKKAILKLLIPFYIAELIYIILFCRGNFTFSYFLNQLFLVDIELPYAWYVRAQLVCYIAWKLCCIKRINNMQKYFIISAVISIYSFIIVCNGMTLTFCKTIICFLLGVVFYDYFSEIHMNENIAKIFSWWCLILAFGVSVCFSRGIIRIAQNVVLELLVTGAISAVFACSSIMLLFYYTGNKVMQMFNNVSIIKSSYELYLIQGIIQCFFMTTYFCNNTFYEIANPFLARIVIIALDVILAYVFYCINIRVKRR